MIDLLIKHWRVVAWCLIFVYIYPLLLFSILIALIVYGTAVGALSAILTLISVTYRNWFVQKPGYTRTLSKLPGMKSANSLVMSCSTFLYSLPFAALFYLTINALQFDDMRSIIAFSSIGLIPIVGWFALGWQLPLPKRKDLLRKPVQQSLITYESRSLPLDSRSYTETLPDGGTLHVSRDRWSISYIFPGPDRRYNSTFYSIDGPKVEAFINALVEGWAEGERLQTIAPESGSLSKTGKEDVGIHASSNHVSVYLPNIRISVHSKDELEKLVSMYQYARDRAREMAQYLSQI